MQKLAGTAHKLLGTKQQRKPTAIFWCGVVSCKLSELSRQYITVGGRRQADSLYNRETELLLRWTIT